MGGKSYEVLCKASAVCICVSMIHISYQKQVRHSEERPGALEVNYVM